MSPLMSVNASTAIEGLPSRRQGFRRIMQKEPRDGQRRRGIDGHTDRNRQHPHVNAGTPEVEDAIGAYAARTPCVPPIPQGQSPSEIAERRQPPSGRRARALRAYLPFPWAIIGSCKPVPPDDDRWRDSQAVARNLRPTGGDRQQGVALPDQGNGDVFKRLPCSRAAGHFGWSCAMLLWELPPGGKRQWT
jgi:hypothetical protein